MKKFNADGGYRGDIKKDIDEHDLNDYSGRSLEETTEALDDTMLFTDEQLKEINDISKEEGNQEIYR